MSRRIPKEVELVRVATLGMNKLFPECTERENTLRAEQLVGEFKRNAMSHESRRGFSFFFGKRS